METLIDVPTHLHGLRVLDEDSAMEQGFHSITTAINKDSESAIMAGVAQHRNPERAVWIHCYGPIYELAILREDISHIVSE